MGVKNRIWILMGKKLSGSLTPEEEQELDGLFQTYPDVWKSPGLSSQQDPACG